MTASSVAVCAGRRSGWMDGFKLINIYFERFKQSSQSEINQSDIISFGRLLNLEINVKSMT